MVNAVPSWLSTLSDEDLKLMHDLAVILDRSKFTNKEVARAAVALGEERHNRLWRSNVLRKIAVNN